MFANNDAQGNNILVWKYWIWSNEILIFIINAVDPRI